MIKVLVRKKKGEVYLFFPEYEANQGNLLSYQWIGQHCEASLGFYKSTKPCDDVALVKHYEQHYDCELQVVKRLPKNFREKDTK